MTYPFLLGLKSRKIEVETLGASFFPLGIKVQVKHKQPKALKESMS